MIQWPDINIREVTRYDAMNYLRALAAELVNARGWALCLEGQHCDKVVEGNDREIAISTLPEAQRGSALWMLQQNLALTNKVIKSQRVEIKSLKKWKDNPQNRQCLAAEIKKLQRDLNLERDKKTTRYGSIDAKETPWPRCTRHDPPEDINGVRKQPCCCPDCIDFTQQMSHGSPLEAEDPLIKERRLQELNMLALRDADAERQQFVSDLRALDEQKAALGDDLHDSGQNITDAEHRSKEGNIDEAPPVTSHTHRLDGREEHMYSPSAQDSEMSPDGGDNDEDDNHSDASSDYDSDTDSDDGVVIIMDNLREYDPDNPGKNPHIAASSRKWARDLEMPDRAPTMQTHRPSSEGCTSLPQFSPGFLGMVKLPQTLHGVPRHPSLPVPTFMQYETNPIAAPESNPYLSWAGEVQAKVDQQDENEECSTTSDFLDMNPPLANNNEVDDFAIDVRQLSPTAESFVPNSAFGVVALNTKQTTNGLMHQENRPRVCLPVCAGTSRFSSAGKQAYSPAKVDVPVATLSSEVAGSGLGGSKYAAISDADLEPRSRELGPLEAAALYAKVGSTRPTPTVALPRRTDQLTTNRPECKSAATKGALSTKSVDTHVDSGYTTADEGASIEERERLLRTVEPASSASTPPVVSSDVSVVTTSDMAQKALAPKTNVLVDAPLVAAAKQARVILRSTPSRTREPQATQHSVARTFPPPKLGGLGASRYATAQDPPNEAADCISGPRLGDPPPALDRSLEDRSRNPADCRRKAVGTMHGFTNSGRRNQKNTYQDDRHSSARGQSYAKALN